jgi:hypothetical protein
MDADRYHANVGWSEEDACGVTDILDLAHGSALGATPELAMHEGQIAKAAWFGRPSSVGQG